MKDLIDSIPAPTDTPAWQLALVVAWAGYTRNRPDLPEVFDFDNPPDLILAALHSSYGSNWLHEKAFNDADFDVWFDTVTDAAAGPDILRRD